MAIELHHLHPSHDDEVARLKARIAELEKENKRNAGESSARKSRNTTEFSLCFLANTQELWMCMILTKANLELTCLPHGCRCRRLRRRTNEQAPFGFGGENHDKTKCESCNLKKVYLKSDADRYIAELKEKLKKARLKLKKVK